MEIIFLGRFNPSLNQQIIDSELRDLLHTLLFHSSSFQTFSKGSFLTIEMLAFSRLLWEEWFLSDLFLVKLVLLLAIRLYMKGFDTELHEGYFIPALR